MQLKDLVDIYLGVTHTPEYVDKGVPFLSVKDISSGKIEFDNCKFISEEEYDSLPNGAKPQIGDMLFCRVGTLGKPIIIEENTPKFGSFVSLGFLRNKDSSICNLRYLLHWMNSNAFWKQVKANVKGASQVNLNTGWLSKFQVKEYSLDKQLEIVNKLDKIQGIIELRQTQLAKLDELVKARFVEMFGIYPDNEKGWAIGTIRDLVTEVRYGSSRKAAIGTEGKYPYLRMNNITYSGELDLSDLKTIDIPDNEISKCTVRRGDVLFNRTNSKELVGKTCVYNSDEIMVLAGFIVRVRVNEKVIPEFLAAFLNTDFSKNMLYSMCKAAIGQANINAQELQNIGIYIPPIELQEKFLKIKEQVDKTKALVQKALEKTQLLFDSLMQEYFG